MTGPSGKYSGDNFSLARLALFSLGAAVAVLAVTTVIVVLVDPTRVVGLVIGLIGVAAAIAAMGVVSKRMTRNACGDGDQVPTPGSGS